MKDPVPPSPILRPTVDVIVRPGGEGLPWEAGRNAPITGGAAGTIAGAIEGVDGFSATVWYGNATSTSLEGSATMTLAALVRVDAVPTGLETLIGRGSGALSYHFGADASGFRLTVNSAVSPQRAIVAGDVGKWFLVIGTYDGSSVRLYVQDAEVGSGTPKTGYTGNSNAPAFGRLSNATASNGAVSFAMAAWGHHATSAKSGAAVASIYNAAFVAGDLADADWEHRYSVADDGGGTPATLTDRVGIIDMTLTGALTAVSDATPTWGDP